MLNAIFVGYSTAFSLILAIGAQNAFVLRQGIMGAHVFWVCLFCAVSDAVLITAGVLGFGAITDRWPLFPEIMRYGGAAFLVVYGAMRFRSALSGGSALVTEGEAQALVPAILTCAVLTWANPHVYLDTLGLIGAVSTTFPWGAEKTAFGIAAIAASFTFFFSLGYGAALLRPIMASPRAWTLLDAGIGLLMWALAAMLIFLH